ncbi:MAG: hypothetical protein WKF54_03945 [Nocardioidaceae bacterium]
MKVVLVVLRSTALAAVVGSAVSAAWWLTGDATGELYRTVRSGRLTRPAWTLDHLVTDLASVLCLAAVLGLAAAVALAGAGTLAADRAPRLSAACVRLTPRLCLRLVATCCGLAMVGPLSFDSAATADQRYAPPCHAPCRTATPGLQGLALPDLPTGTWQHGIPDAGPADGREGGGQVGAPGLQIVVRAGDSLWWIAERELPVDASLALVAALTQRLYEINRRAIGDDPDLIFPGMTLRAPEGSQ